MTGESKSASPVESTHASWTVDTLAVHHAALREADLAFQTERDRRYAEVKTELEKAQFNADAMEERAMQLAREIQTYKDVKANELREQLGKERLDYASKMDLKASVEKIEETLKPIIEFISVQRGQARGTDNVWKYIFSAAAFVSVVIGVLALFSNRVPQQVTPQVIYVPAPAPAAPQASPSTTTTTRSTP